jgi:NAD(P)-dependent dehydrogenase (short-subunit alcohol dehydrogenase family)
MRILIWRGYLLGGTGSNVYTRSLARAWRRLGHEVIVICRDPRPEDHDLLGVRVVRPPIGPRLPVFVLDSYEDVEACLLAEMPRAELDRIVEANAAAMRAELPADLVLVNHVLLGAPVGSAAGAPFVVKAHGSELEHAMRGDPDLCRWARETLAAAAAVVAGSEHVRRVPGEVVGPGSYEQRVRVVPPGRTSTSCGPSPASTRWRA